MCVVFLWIYRWSCQRSPDCASLPGVAGQPALSAKLAGSGAPVPERGCRAGGPGRVFPPFEVAGAGFQGALDTPGHVTEQEASGMLCGFQRTREMLGSGSPGVLGFPVCVVSC